METALLTSEASELVIGAGDWRVYIIIVRPRTEEIHNVHVQKEEIERFLTLTREVSLPYYYIVVRITAVTIPSINTVP